MTIRFLLTCITLLILPIQLTLASNSALDERQIKRLSSTIMNNNMTLQKRVEALKTLHADELVNGKVERSFCVWDILGRSGPVYATVEDQRFRAFHYGLELTVKAYQSETLLIDDLRSGVCDAALMSGARAMGFNRFTGSIEALGGIPDDEHLHTVFQLLSSPKLSKRMVEGEYVVLGVTTLGENYLYSQTGKALSLSDLSGMTVGVPSYDQSLSRLAEAYQAKVELGELLPEVSRFSEKKIEALIAPIIGYHFGGASQIEEGQGIVDALLSQSTIQLIGRYDRFPEGIAQLIREDFLMKYGGYKKRLDSEKNNLPKELWFEVSNDEKAKLDQQLTEIRISLREQGIYDSYMLKLLKRVRCHLNQERAECQDNRE